MPIQHAIWKVGEKPTPLSTGRLASEQKLEEMIVNDSRIFSSNEILKAFEDPERYDCKS